MTDLAKRIAVLLMRYEFADDPPPEEECTEGTLNVWLQFPHDGDCVGQAMTCLRCLADEWMHKGQWIADRLEEIK